MNKNLELLKARAKCLRLYGVIANWEEFANEPWLEKLLDIEEKERSNLSLLRRTKHSKIGKFKPFADFDWRHPTGIDRQRISELFSLEFIKQPYNILLIGPSGVGKTMIAQNLAYHAVNQGYTSLFVTSNSLLMDLAEQRTTSALSARLKHYSRPDILVIDELGYQAASNNHAELLFELVNRRYTHKPIILTSNRSFSEWHTIFPNSSCIVALIDRLLHHSEVFNITAEESYRLKEAQARAGNYNKTKKHGK
jgi:DNA replication protein DnaC